MSAAVDIEIVFLLYN